MLAIIALLAALPGIHALPPAEEAERQRAMSRAFQMNRAVQLVDVDVPPVYAPYRVDCPANMTWVRAASTGIAEGEKAYLDKRASQIDKAVEDLTHKAGIDKPKRTPIIGLSMSGGGYRAMINTLGQAQALMAGTNGTGGWMDAVSYMAGLSGGSWATATFAANGGHRPTDLNENVWDIDVNLISPPNSSVFLSSIASEVKAKLDLGFPVQITDIWGLALGNHLLPREYRLDTNPNMTISGLAATTPAFANATLPFPIIIAAGIEHPKSFTPENGPFFEYTPFEFGTWDSSNTTEGGYFTPVQWLGSTPDNGTCYNGYDQMSFIAGVSSTLFNQLPFPASTLFPNTSFPWLNQTTDSVATVPNPFEGYNGTENPDPSDPDLILVDAGETRQNLPLEPLLAPARKVDVILAFDASGDTDLRWPNGAALWTSYKQYQNSSEFKMPPVPSPNGFINGGLNTRPTFFGCNQTDGPLVVYVPNYPYAAWTNISTFTFTQTKNATAAQIDSVMQTVTLGGHAAWPTCLACALTDRANGYDSASRPSPCAQCFASFCWDGVDNATTPATYAPAVGPPVFARDLNLTLPAPKDDHKNAAVGRGVPRALVGAAVAGFALLAAL